jgi:putative phosphoserine phosphatase / 1-acylglycerol-3-phosphate O-acyltransferase
MMSPTEAAIFDLDRTLVAHSTGRAFQRALRANGLGGERELPGAATLYSLFSRVGENGLTMRLVRLGVRAVRGWSVDTVRAAAGQASEELAADVLPYAALEMEDHRAAGRALVLATTSPYALVAPLAERLGFDAVVATRWEQRDGVYTGALQGRFVWGRGKLLAVREWAAGAGVDLARSWAYSDSYYDAPLLAAVGHPRAVNPDARLTGLAVLQRWPIRWFDVPEGVVKIAGRELQEWLRPLANELFVRNARIDISGLENIPARGAAIVAFNHRSYFDATVVGMAIARSGRSARGIGKKEVFDAPLIGPFMKAFGGIRVHRGTGSDEPLEAAERALRAGELVMIAPEGTIPRGPAFFEPELRGRWGTARLAQRSGAPVIPMGLWGTEHVWPRSQRLPTLTFAGPAPHVTCRLGSPVALEHDDVDADTRRIMAAITDLLPAEARERRQPTAEELRRTFPAGYRGDPQLELERRPGTDT